MFRLLLASSLLIVHVSQAQVLMPATTRVGLDELALLAERYPDAKQLTAETQGNYPTAMVGGRCTVGFLGRTSGSVGLDAGAEGDVMLGSSVGNIVSFRVDAYHLDALDGITGLDYMELAGKAVPTLDKVLVSTRADSVQQGINLPQSYTGRDVLIGITDWGFDYTHPMFYDTALTTSRVRAAWDQYRQAGPAPLGYSYGTELTTPEALLAAQSDTVNIYGNATHGSHVAGIAGGSGAGTAYRGIAFDAQYVFCTFLVDAASVIDAFTWMKSIADQDQKRLVINMSWGLYWIGTLDGTSLISQAIDQLSLEGVVFVNSGGNNGDYNFHIKKTFTGDMLRSRIQFYPYSAHPKMWGQSISMWGAAGEAFSAGFIITNGSGQTLQETPLYNTATQPAYLDSFMVQGTDTVFFNLTAEAAHPLNGRPHFRLRVKNRNGLLRIALKATAPQGTVHFWNVTELSNDVGNWGQEFQAYGSGTTAGDALYGIGEPACTASLITVAAYNSEYLSQTGTYLGGAIAAFSSTGPTLDERIKPDISAPGVGVASSISSFTDNNFTPFISVDFQGRTYPFSRFSGTSMSGPAVTGVVAMLLEADPTLTPAALKTIIQQTARTDNNTGVIPPGGSTRWGFGKVNAYRAVAEALGVVGIHEVDHTGPLVWPNPVASELNVVTPRNGVNVRISVTDVTGRIVATGTYPAATRVVLDARTWPAGLYLLRMQAGDRVEVTKVVKGQ